MSKPQKGIYGTLSLAPKSGVTDNDIATDTEVSDVIDTVFGKDKEVATDEEVNDVIYSIFGKM